MPQSKRHPARRPQQRPARPSHRNPARQAPAKAPATGARAALERSSAGPLVLLHRMPTWLVPTLLAVLLVLGLAVPSPWAGLLLLVPAAFLGWLLALSWPLLAPFGRLMRLLAVLALVVLAYLRVAGRF